MKVLQDYSRYFSLDSWSSGFYMQNAYDITGAEYMKTFPFLICPKASKAERNKGCEGLEAKKADMYDDRPSGQWGQRFDGRPERIRTNHHPTVKPLKLMSYLITLGSREGDLILDPFCGSGTTCIAAETLNRKYVGIEINEEYYKIAEARLSPYLEQTKLV